MSEKKSIADKLKKELEVEENKILSQPSERFMSERELRAYKKNFVEGVVKKRKLREKIEGFSPPALVPINEWLPIKCVLENKLEAPLAIKFCFGDLEPHESLKDKLLGYFNQNDPEGVQDNETKIPKNLRYRNEIAGCFSRKKIK